MYACMHVYLCVHIFRQTKMLTPIDYGTYSIQWAYSKVYELNKNFSPFREHGLV
jgi:hypothetical protein